MSEKNNFKTNKMTSKLTPNQQNIKSSVIKEIKSYFTEFPFNKRLKQLNKDQLFCLYDAILFQQSVGEFGLILPMINHNSDLTTVQESIFKCGLFGGSKKKFTNKTIYLYLIVLIAY